MTRIIIVVLELVAAVSACQYPACVEADRLARQCGGGGHCAELRQAQQRACGEEPVGGHSFGDLGLPPSPSKKSGRPPCPHPMKSIARSSKRSCWPGECRKTMRKRLPTSSAGPICMVWT